MEIIRLINISKKYGKENRTTALENINLTINKGEFIAIMGPSGSGKSTLLNIIGTMDKPSDGSYYLNGVDISNLKDEELSNIRNKHLSFVFQHFALMKNYSVYDNVELPLIFRRMKKREKQILIESTLKELNIINHINKKVTGLSGGQQQRVAIARALVSGAEIILADEPTGALDQKTGIELMELLVKLNSEGKTIILVTHDENIASFCSKKIIIKDGKIIE